MKIIRTIIIVLLILLTNCKQIPNAQTREFNEILNSSPVQINPKLKIRLKNQTGMDTPPKILVTPEKVLIFHFDANGSSARTMYCDTYSHRLDWQWRKEIFIGQGPGDVSIAIRFFFINNRIYALDYGLDRLSIFDRNMKFIDIKKIRSAGSLSLFSSDGRKYLWITTGRRNIDMTIFQSNVGGSSNKKFAYFGPFPGKIVDDQKNLLYRKLRPDILLFKHMEKVYCLNCKEYSIHRMTNTGYVDSIVHYKIPVIKLSTEENEKNMTIFIKKHRIRQGRRKWIFAPIVQQAAGVLCLNKGFIVLRRENYDPECYGEIQGDYFTYDLIPKGKFNVPCYIQCKSEFGFHTQHVWGNGIYLIQQADDNEGSDWLTYWEVVE